ncbi:hypothetical protein WDW37_15365 [Bdellovibrionota bacterium FG-1]
MSENVHEDALTQNSMPTSPRPALHAKTPTTSDDFIRVALSRIDKLMNNVGELVILQTGMSQTRHLLQSETQLTTIFTSRWRFGQSSVKCRSLK